MLTADFIARWRAGVTSQEPSENKTVFAMGFRYPRKSGSPGEKRSNSLRFLDSHYQIFEERRGHANTYQRLKPISTRSTALDCY
jgi:hypothetical protein